MRIRALRWSIALLLAVGAATAGVSAHHSSLRAVLRDITRSSAAQVSTSAVSGLSGVDVSTRTHARVPVIDAAPGPAMVLVVAVAVVVAVSRRRQRMSVAVRESQQSRAPPGRR